MSFNLESYIEAIKLELAKYKVNEIKNVCKAFNQRERIYITGKSKQQLIDEIADRLEFLLKTKVGKKKAGARYKGKGLGDDLLNAAMPYISQGVTGVAQATKKALDDTLKKFPGMDFLYRAATNN
jgi:hypothetical protein